MAMSQPTGSEIRSAKRKAVGGGRKRCRRGKNCSAACIQSGMDCLVEMPEPVGVALGKVSKGLQGRLPSVPGEMKKELAALGAPPQAVAKNDLSKWATNQLKDQRKAAWALGKDDKVAQIDAELARRKGGDVLDVKAKTVGKSITAPSASGGTRYDRGDAKDFDLDLSSGPLRRVGDENYSGWNDSHGSGSKTVGAGAYGTVIRNKDGTFVKRGAISETEADLIEALGKVGLGPKLVAADINGAHPWHSEKFVNIRKGRIAMGEVPGKPIGEVGASTKIAGKPVPDIYWKAMAGLHRQGIAHNDAHIDNILVDDKGTGRWVDLGLAQRSPKAALAEAMGIFKPLKGGDDIVVARGASGNGNWQTSQWDATGVRLAERMKREGKWTEFQQRFPVAAKVWDNQQAAVSKLENFGLDTNEINSIIVHGIRAPQSSYTYEGFGRLTDGQAQEVLNTLYDGI